MFNPLYRIAGIEYESVVDGPGIRNAIFFQGCNHHCSGCHNPETHNPKKGYEQDLLSLLVQWKKNPLISGITLTGGDPFYFLSIRDDVSEFYNRIKNMFILINKIKELEYDCIIYTGYTTEELLEYARTISAYNVYEAMNNILVTTDVIITDPYIEKYRTLELPFRGSSNQRVCKFYWKKDKLEFIDKTVLWNQGIYDMGL